MKLDIQRLLKISQIPIGLIRLKTLFMSIPH